MTESQTACPATSSPTATERFLICPECGHEWSPNDTAADESPVYKDAVGNVLVDGDSVTVIKDLKVKEPDLLSRPERRFAISGS